MTVHGSKRDFIIEFGIERAVPGGGLAHSPTGGSWFFDPEGELAVARAAAKAGTLFALSTASTFSGSERRPENVSAFHLQRSRRQTSDLAANPQLLDITKSK